MAEEEEEDDYLNMTFEDTKPKQETSLQRTARLKKEAAERGRVLSKAERAKKEEEAREKALATELNASNMPKGAAMMAKMGFKGGALGKSEDARTRPIEVNVKDGRTGIGMESDKKRKIREEAEALLGREKKRQETAEEYRQRTRDEREERRAEGMSWSAMRILEGYDTGQVDGDEQQSDGVDLDRRPLSSIPLLYRSIHRQRRQKARDVTRQKDFEYSLSRRQDDELEKDDKIALGTEVDDLEDDTDDPELDEFRALPAVDRLQKIVDELRSKYNYCFWCKYKYEDASMDGCPGLTEEEHG